jgi:hypothetical protein
MLGVVDAHASQITEQLPHTTPTDEQQQEDEDKEEE